MSMEDVNKCSYRVALVCGHSTALCVHFCASWSDIIVVAGVGFCFLFFVHRFQGRSPMLWCTVCNGKLVLMRKSFSRPPCLSPTLNTRCANPTWCTSRILYMHYTTPQLSGGTIASAMDIYSMMWSGGSRVKKMMKDPLLLTYPPSEGGDGNRGCAESSRFKNARGPGGLGYDSMAKCELRGLKTTLTQLESRTMARMVYVRTLTF